MSDQTSGGEPVCGHRGGGAVGVRGTAMSKTRDSWKVTTNHGVLSERRVGLHTFIEGAVWTPKGIVTVDAGAYEDGDRYLSVRFIWRGRCHSLYTETFGVFTRPALTRRASRFVAEVTR
jgi:hypothetical protein